MISYTGEECIVCKKEFADGDDIVACPQCGTPYHRECYKKKNECVNYALHETGGSWMADAVKTKKSVLSGIRKVCPECSFINPEDADQCRNCGTELAGRECRTIDLSDQKVVKIELDADADYFGMNPMEVMDEGSGITIGEMGDYAASNKLYYMLSFRRLKKSAVKFSVNFLAFFFPEAFCAGRKMFAACTVLMLVLFGLQIPSMIDAIVQMETMGYAGIRMYANLINFAKEHAFSEDIIKLTYSLGIALRVAFSLFANELYFRHTLSKLKKLRKSVPDYLRYRNVIKTSGGISVVGIVCSFLIQFLLMVLFLLVVVIMAQ